MLRPHAKHIRLNVLLFDRATSREGLTCVCVCVGVCLQKVPTGSPVWVRISICLHGVDDYPCCIECLIGKCFCVYFSLVYLHKNSVCTIGLVRAFFRFYLLWSNSQCHARQQYLVKGLNSLLVLNTLIFLMVIPLLICVLVGLCLEKHLET